MSFAVTILAVDLAAVAAAYGCGRAGLVNEVIDADRSFAAGIDEGRAEQEEDSEPDDILAPMTLAAALGEIVAGHLSVPLPCRDLGAETVYGAALLALCRHYGDELPNLQWEVVHSDWFETVDAALAAAGVPVDVFTTSMLFLRRPPCGPADLPTGGVEIGHVLPADADRLAVVLSGAVESIVASEAAESVAEIAEGITEIATWLSTATARGRGVGCAPS